MLHYNSLLYLFIIIYLCIIIIRHYYSLLYLFIIIYLCIIIMLHYYSLLPEGESCATTNLMCALSLSALCSPLRIQYTRIDGLYLLL